MPLHRPVISRTPTRRGAAVAVSLLLHAAAVLLYLYIPEPGRPGSPNADEPFEVVLLPQPAAPSQPDAAGSEAPAPVRPPDPESQELGATTAPAPAAPAQQAEAQPPPLPEPAPPSPIPPLASLVPPPELPMPAPEPPAPEPPLLAPTVPEPSPPQPEAAPVPPSPPTVRLFAPDDAAPFSPPQSPPQPLPLPPLPVPPAPPRPQPRPTPPPIPRRTPPGTAFSNPMVLDFGPSQREAARPRPGRGIDLTLGPVRPAAPGAPSSRGSQADIRAPNVSPEWASLFRAWVEAHKYYPEQAVRNGEDGPVTVQFEVDRDGRVSNLQLVGRSGSQWLDMGLQAMLRGARVPPLPPGTRDDRVPVTLTMHYILIRR